MSAGPDGVTAELRFVLCDPEEPPASELLAAMRTELIGAYDNASRLDNPPLLPAELRAPAGAYYVGYEGPEAVAGGGLRRLGDGVAEIKRMYVRPEARSRGVAAALLRTLEEAARALGYTRTRLDTGPEAGDRAAPLPWRRIRGDRAVQRQSLCVLLGREAAGLRRPRRGASGRGCTAARRTRSLTW